MKRRVEFRRQCTGRVPTLRQSRDRHACTRRAAEPGLWRVSCLNCGYAKDTTTNSRTFDSGSQQPVRDPVFRLPLWLQASCCGGKLLWAYNIEHLVVLDAFIAAKIRYKRCANCGRHHHRMIHKLSAWMKTAKNRDELLATIAKLRATIEA